MATQARVTKIDDKHMVIISTEEGVKSYIAPDAPSLAELKDDMGIRRDEPCTITGGVYSTSVKQTSNG